MALTWRQGSFALNTGTGNQTVDTGAGVTGMGLILWVTPQSAEGFAVPESGCLSYIASSTQRKCLTWFGTDNVVPDIARGFNDLALNIFSAATPTVDLAADFVDFTTGGAGRFTIDITNAPTAAWICHYIFIAGVANVWVGHKTAKTVSIGNQAETGVGFQGNLALFLALNATALGNAAGIGIGIGAAVSATARGCSLGLGRDGHAASDEHYSNNAACVAINTANGNGLDAVADFVSFDTDGWTLNWTDFATSAWLYGAMIIKGSTGDNFDVDEILCPAATGNQSITTGFGMTDGGVFFFGTGQTTANATLGSQRHTCIGAMGESPLAENHIWGGSDDGATVSQTEARNVTTKCIGVATVNSTVAAEADANALGTTTYTINWTTVRTNSRFFGVAMAPTAAVVVPPKPTVVQQAVARAANW